MYSGGISAQSAEASAVPSAVVLLSQGQPALASSSSNNYLPALAFDGDAGTRWSSAFADPQWIQVDLGAVRGITDIKLDWEVACGRDYQLQVSNDGLNWTTVQAVAGNTTTGWLDYPGLSASGRYVRMYGTARATAYGYSLYEFQVYGTAAATTLTVSNASGTVGQTIHLVGRLRRADNAKGYLPGKTLSFQVEGAAVTSTAGKIVTDSNGFGVDYYLAPGSLTVGTHTLSAAFAGDSAYTASSGNRQP